MNFSPMGLLLTLCALMLGYFTYRRFIEYRQDETNTINYHYWLATFMISIGFVFYGLPSVIFPETDSAIAFGNAIATIANAIGFGQFFLIPIYSWWSSKIFTLSKYILYLYITLIAGLIVLIPPQTHLDAYGIIHWRFNILESWAMLLLIATAFILNIKLLSQNMAKLKMFSYLNAVALILTFSTTGIGGSYMYVGDGTVLLFIATILIYIGISIIFFASFHTARKTGNAERTLQ